MSDPSSRRNFLRGKVSSHRAQPRPPWALPEEEFLSRCTRCGDCARACPTRIIRQGDGGYPAVDFASAECTFCGECVVRCPAGALRRSEGEEPWALRAMIGEACLANRFVECRICGEMCDPRVIRFPPRAGGIAQPDLDAAACTGCGACVSACPASAIAVA